jgi:hypothetical protein
MILAEELALLGARIKARCGPGAAFMPWQCTLRCDGYIMKRKAPEIAMAPSIVSTKRHLMTSPAKEGTHVNV